MLYGLVMIFHVIACFVLIAVILLQAGRGGGLADAAGGAAQSILGTRGTAVLTRATTVCAILFMVTSLSLAYLSTQHGRSLMETAAASAPKKPAAPAPAKEPTVKESPAAEKTPEPASSSAPAPTKQP